MTTRRNKLIEDEGTIYIQNLVRKHNCIYQEVELKNDQGNDCYIEFITNEVATSFCVFAQIKSGKSYRDKSGYKILTDHNHLAYWANHTNPVAGIVYDELKQEAYWVNISKYLKDNPQILKQKTHSIRVPKANNFSLFTSFKNHFTQHIQYYKSMENYGRSLDYFAQIDKPNICYDGFKSLYSNHRNKSSAWHYMIANFGKIKESGIHRNILGVISNYIPSDEVLWTNKNKEFLYQNRMQEKLSKLLTESFGLQEISLAIDFMREGIVRGTFNYKVYKVLSLIGCIHEKLLKITYSETLPERRDFDFWLFIHFSQRHSLDFTINKIDEYLQQFPDADPDGVLQGMRQSLLNREIIPIG